MFRWMLSYNVLPSVYDTRTLFFDGFLETFAEAIARSGFGVVHRAQSNFEIEILSKQDASISGTEDTINGMSCHGMRYGMCDP